MTEELCVELIAMLREININIEFIGFVMLMMLLFKDMS